MVLSHSELFIYCSWSWYQAYWHLCSLVHCGVVQCSVVRCGVVRGSLPRFIVLYTSNTIIYVEECNYCSYFHKAMWFFPYCYFPCMKQISLNTILYSSQNCLTPSTRPKPLFVTVKTWIKVFALKLNLWDYIDVVHNKVCFLYYYFIKHIITISYASKQVFWLERQIIPIRRIWLKV